MRPSRAMPSGRPLVLASTSIARRTLLDRFRIPYDVVAPTCDEDAIGGSTTDETARLRALAKAESVAAVRSGAVVLGSDQLVDLDGEVLGKPGSAERAIAQLERLAGRMHRLVTAVALVGHRSEGPELALCVHSMHMRSLARNEIERYVAADEPAWCAGSYKVESLGISLFERIEGPDWTAIMGLPLLCTGTMLRQAGWELP